LGGVGGADGVRRPCDAEVRRMLCGALSDAQGDYQGMNHDSAPFPSVRAALQRRASRDVQGMIHRCSFLVRQCGSACIRRAGDDTKTGSV